MSTADSNTANPDAASPTNWVPAPGLISSGTPIPSFGGPTLAGYVLANTLTIGNASSNGTARANADTLLLYRFLWNNFSNTACPIYTSAGSPSTRGANPDADFNANKALATPDMRGRSLIGTDVMGGPSTSRLTGVPVISGNPTLPASILGENLHTSTLTETPTGITATNTTLLPVTVTSTPGNVVQGTVTNSFQSGTSGTFPDMLNTGAVDSSINSTGDMSVAVTSNNTGGGAHNNVEQSLTVYWNLKL
jgi:hypothetical protein